MAPLREGSDAGRIGIERLRAFAESDPLAPRCAGASGASSGFAAVLDDQGALVERLPLSGGAAGLVARSRELADRRQA